MYKVNVKLIILLVNILSFTINNIQQQEQITSPTEMKIDQKPRDFAYISHKENLPLELKGNMKRTRPQSSIHKQSSEPIVKDPQLIQRIIQNYKDLKSVVPLDFSDSKKIQSIKILNHQQYSQVSGAAYLMSKPKKQRDHPQKKHLQEKHINQNCNQSGHKQKKHFASYQKEKEKQNQENVSQVPRKHSDTLYKKIGNDLYSRMDLKENITSMTVKMNERSMFKEGRDLGYQTRKQPKISSAKQKQVSGSYNLSQADNKKKKRQDWRRSSIAFG